MTTCPKCGAAETESNGPRTTYACGSSDYDQRPGTLSGPCATTDDATPSDQPHGERVGEPSLEALRRLAASAGAAAGNLDAGIIALYQAGRDDALRTREVDDATSVEVARLIRSFMSGLPNTAEALVEKVLAALRSRQPPSAGSSGSVDAATREDAAEAPSGAEPGTPTEPGVPAGEHCAACDQYGDPSYMANVPGGCPGVSQPTQPSPLTEELRNAIRSRPSPEPNPMLMPRPLAIRNGVADMMVDALAKQIQKVAVYSSKARRWRDRAIELGSAPDYVFEADAEDVKHDEVCLKEARGVLANAWEQQGHTERDGDQAPDAQGGERSGGTGQRDEAAVPPHVIEEPNPDGWERLREAEAEELLSIVVNVGWSKLSLPTRQRIADWYKKYDARKGTPRCAQRARRMNKV